MALASCPARHGQQRSLRRMRQVLSWALPRSPGDRSWAWARLASFCEAGLPRPRYGMRMWCASVGVAPVGQDHRQKTTAWRSGAKAR